MKLILGAKGMLGQQLLNVFGNEAVGWDREDVDVTNTGNLRLKIRDLNPSVIINCVAYNDVDGAESNPDLAFKLNTEAVENLAAIAKELDIPLVHFSTNYVFDGAKGEYSENDQPNPLSVYAKSKYQGETLAQKKNDKFYLIRTAVLFGQKGESTTSKRSFVDLMLDLSQKSDTIKAVTDETNSITLVNDLALAVKHLLDEHLPYGIYHITNAGGASWFDLAREIFIIIDKKINLVPVLSSEFARKAQRPKKSILMNTKLPAFRPWQEALREYLMQAMS